MQIIPPQKETTLEDVARNSTPEKQEQSEEFQRNEPQNTDVPLNFGLKTQPNPRPAPTNQDQSDEIATKAKPSQNLGPKKSTKRKFRTRKESRNCEVVHSEAVQSQSQCTQTQTKTHTQTQNQTQTQTKLTPGRILPKYNECDLKKKRILNPIDEIIMQRITQNSTPDGKITLRG